MKLTLQILDNNNWIDVVGKERTMCEMTQLYRSMRQENPDGPPYGMRIVTVHFEHIGPLSSTSNEQISKWEGSMKI